MRTFCNLNQYLIYKDQKEFSRLKKTAFYFLENVRNIYIYILALLVLLIFVTFFYIFFKPFFRNKRNRNKNRNIFIKK